MAEQQPPVAETQEQSPPDPSAGDVQSLTPDLDSAQDPQTAQDPGAPNEPTAPGDDPDVAQALADAGTDLDQTSIDDLLKQASFEDPSALSPDDGALPEGSPLNLQNFTQVLQDAQVSSIDLLRDVELNVKIELGRSRMLVEDILKLAEGAVVELDKLAGDPVDVFVNDRLVARGEVLVLNDNFCVRINEIVAGIKEEGA